MYRSTYVFATTAGYMYFKPNTSPIFQLSLKWAEPDPRLSSRPTAIIFNHDSALLGPSCDFFYIIGH